MDPIRPTELRTLPVAPGVPTLEEQRGNSRDDERAEADGELELRPCHSG